jgi:hypothetical protein
MEFGVITILVVGILLIVLGCINMTGNISSLHSYHRHRVTEADRKPFGRLVGAGTATIGVAFMLGGALIWIGELIAALWLIWMAIGIMVAGFAVGLAVSFYAMIKYNKGIF